MLDLVIEYQTTLFVVWLGGAVLLAMWFGTIAEMEEAAGRTPPGIGFATSVACLWPFATIAALAYGCAALWRALRK